MSPSLYSYSPVSHPGPLLRLGSPLGTPPQRRQISPKAPILGSGCLTITMDTASFSPAGYNAEFLQIPLPLPAPPAGTSMRELTYTHFTVLLDPARRFAITTGVNIDGDQLVDVD